MLFSLEFYVNYIRKHGVFIWGARSWTVQNPCKTPQIGIPTFLGASHQNVKWNVNRAKWKVGNGKRETKRGKLKVECFCYHEVNHAKSGKSKEEMKSGKLGMGGLREAVGAGLPTKMTKKLCNSLQKGGSRVKRFTLLPPFCRYRSGIWALWGFSLPWGRTCENEK